MNETSQSGLRARRARLSTAVQCVGDRTYGPWFAAQIFSASGGLTQSVAAAWLMYRMTHSATWLAAMSASMLLPVLLFSVWTGSLADRLDRRRLLLVTQTAFVSIGASLAVGAAAGALRPWVLVVSAFLTGVVLAVDSPARQVYVLDIVGTGRLAAAVSLYEIVVNSSRIVGPGIGGTLLGVSGPPAAFAFNAACFLPAIVVLVMHGRSGVRSSGAGTPRRRHTAVLPGLRYAFGTPLIRSCLVLAGLSGILFNGTVLMPLLAVRSFHLGADGYGLLMAAFGIGAFPGALFAATGAARPNGRKVATLAALTGLAMLLTSSAPTPLLAYLGMGVTGFASIWFIAVANTLVQLVAAPHMRGRVMGAWTMMLPGLGPVTGLLTAGLVDATSPRIAFAAAGSLILLAAVGPLAVDRQGRGVRYGVQMG